MFLVITLAATVYLNAPKYIRRDDYIHITCSSDETPIFSTANFYINGVAYTSLRREDYGCYSARVKCPLDSLTCYCSRDGKQYGLLIHSSVTAKIMTVSCKMRFFKNGQTSLKSDDLIVQIHGKLTTIRVFRREWEFVLIWYLISIFHVMHVHFSCHYRRARWIYEHTSLKVTKVKLKVDKVNNHFTNLWLSELIAVILSTLFSMQTLSSKCLNLR